MKKIIFILLSGIISLAVTAQNNNGNKGTPAIVEAIQMQGQRMKITKEKTSRKKKTRRKS
jgi:hypothetical protein